MKTLFLTQSGQKRRGARRAQSTPVSKLKNPGSVAAGSSLGSSWIPSAGRVRRGFSSEPASSSGPHAGSSPGTLEVIRCRGFGTGAQETRLSDGTVQMRLPFGEWILALKTAQEIDAEKSSH